MKWTFKSGIKTIYFEHFIKWKKYSGWSISRQFHITCYSGLLLGLHKAICSHQMLHPHQIFSHRLLYKWTEHGKSPKITTDPKPVQNYGK